MEDLYNHWAKIRINDKEVKQLIEIAMSPSKEVLMSLKEENRELLSTKYLNFEENVLEFAFSAPSQLEDTTKGTLFGAYNGYWMLSEHTQFFRSIRQV